MTYLADTHMHSIYSYDGQMRLDDMVRRGDELGLKYMAFTEHLEPKQISKKQFLNRFKLYSEDVDRLQDKFSHIKLLKGVEISNPEIYRESLDCVNELDLDYIIGSNHIIPSIHDEGEILLYYRRILSMVKQGGIDSVGHLDYLRRVVDDNYEIEEILKEIFSEMIKRDICLEVNSSAVRRVGLASFPDSDKLKIYKELGGKKITMGSDAHRIDEIYHSILDVSNACCFDQGVFVKRKFKKIS